MLQAMKILDLLKEHITKIVYVLVIIWYNKSIISKQTPKSVLLLLIGNKNDLKDMREVSYEEKERFAKSNNMIFLETQLNLAIILMIFL